MGERIYARNNLSINFKFYLKFMFRPRSKPYPPLGAVHRQADAEGPGIARDAVRSLRALAGVEALAAAEARVLLRRRRVVAERAVDAGLAVVHVLACATLLAAEFQWECRSVGNCNNRMGGCARA